MSVFENLVVGYDGTGEADRALAWAAEQVGPGNVTLVHGIAPALTQLAESGDVSRHRERCEDMLEHAAAAVRRAGAAEVSALVVDDEPAGAVCDTASTRGADAIVLGHHGRTRRSRHHVGTTAGNVLHHCDVPLLMTNDATIPRRLDGTIVVGLSRQELASVELAWAVDLATRSGAALHLVSLIEPLSYTDHAFSFDMIRMQREAEWQMRDLSDELRRSSSAPSISTEVGTGSPVQGLVDIANERAASLVVVGHHHPGSLGAIISGSVARTLPPQLSCPLAAIPHR